jgi:hypothetical protein
MDLYGCGSSLLGDSLAHSSGQDANSGTWIEKAALVWDWSKESRHISGDLGWSKELTLCFLVRGRAPIARCGVDLFHLAKQIEAARLYSSSWHDLVPGFDMNPNRNQTIVDDVRLKRL